MTFAEYSVAWLAARRGERVLTPSSLQKYGGYLLHHVIPWLGDMPLAAVRFGDVLALMQVLLEAGLAHTTVHTICGCVHAVYAAAQREGLVTSNPATGVQRLARLQRRKRDPIPPGDLERLEAVFWHTPHVQGRVFIVMLHTGLRIGEALALRWENLDPAAAELLVDSTWHDDHEGPTKSRERRWIALTPTALQVIERQRGEHPRYIFPSTVRPLPWSRTQLQHGFRALCEAAHTSAAYTPHQLRHTYATQLVEAGADLRWLSRQLGHATLAMTADLYARHARSPRPQALEAWNARHADPRRPARGPSG